MIVTLLAYGSFMLLLVVAAGDDLRELRIPNGIVAALAAVWIVWRIALAATHPEGALVPALSVADGLLGALVLGGGLLAVTLAFEALTGRRAMGGGDVKLMAAVGLFLGIEGGLVCLLTACLVSLLLALLLPRLGWAPRPAPPTFAPTSAAPTPAPASPAPASPTRTPAASAPRPRSPPAPSPRPPCSKRPSPRRPRRRPLPRRAPPPRSPLPPPRRPPSRRRPPPPRPPPGRALRSMDVKQMFHVKHTPTRYLTLRTLLAARRLRSAALWERFRLGRELPWVLAWPCSPWFFCERPFPPIAQLGNGS